MKKIHILLIFFLLLFIFFEFIPIEEKDGAFIIQRGDNFLEVANNLKSRGYIRSKIVFIYELIKDNKKSEIKAGKYNLEKEMNNQEIINIITKGFSSLSKIIIIPGTTIQDIANTLNKQTSISQEDFFKLALSNNKEITEEFSFLQDKPIEVGYEGYFFPDTYQIDFYQTKEDFIKIVFSNFDKRLNEDLRKNIEKNNRSIFETVIIASMIEKEVIVYEDKQMVSGILWKRLDSGVPLQVDSALLYFLSSDNPSVDDRNIESWYNTYKYKGLPLTPICNPGIESIKAAIYPQNSDYWYYLNTRDGKTIFSKTLGEQLINKAKYLE
ncbi:MAG TPA: endolytic transglycosylase MltG [Candidatus Pacearchaeota archaeon]|nr:endolytic transglycosylase MltG [Candidatus Parcubacteria bacterium]HNP79262.1 endolytic transglycosylase MltG [Candidatus Pacearchaeota archaeon]HOC53517.1 endolytic transglycosylase MltG [Candidatus Pacearchaeota archaeon]HQM24409.1 endolytic transglycosylase MltG [Candidatus Pacearchaeota archaeon]